MGGYIPNKTAMAYNVNYVQNNNFKLQSIKVDYPEATGIPNIAYYFAWGI